MHVFFHTLFDTRVFDDQNFVDFAEKKLNWLEHSWEPKKNWISKIYNTFFHTPTHVERRMPCKHFSKLRQIFGPTSWVLGKIMERLTIRIITTTKPTHAMNHQNPIWLLSQIKLIEPVSCGWCTCIVKIGWIKAKNNNNSECKRSLTVI